VLRQLPRRCGQLSQHQELAVRALSLEQLECLVGRLVGDLVGDLFIASPVGLA